MIRCHGIQVLRKTQVPPSGPQSCSQGAQDGLILLDTASGVKLESRISICSTGARVLQKLESRISNEWPWVRDLAAPVLY